MKVAKWVRLLAVAVMLVSLQVGVSLAADARPGKCITLDGQEVSFFQIDRTLVKGWWNGTPIEVPLETVSEILFLDSPKVNYSMSGNEISSGQIELTRKSDGKKFILRDAFLPSDCDCTFITYTYRNPFTLELGSENLPLDGLKQIIFADTK
ncbi:hypothetical protein C2E25_15580 [Geothermobacter hydrogeniphilus]|uniref:Uncharacterized protein n=1 Tax=Geothermobacter hydrogeniphilus TaxID=1969733 RepID=A0A1X0Y551_9BACT|nr:hypothetical protein [Geothermobacter hydrogeniphilus]ORJ60266.1 hypothetical protein B5V00_08420 [Geothermobacter hydrogeniphilus]PNU18859.1 hypothetical protein C2E25_15580 [Geothermobacter hydrogeniphilus]